MKHRIALLLPLILLLFVIGGWRAMTEISMPRQNPSTFTPKQWTGVFAVTTGMPPAQRIGLWADLVAVDAEYVGDPLGEGPGKTPDADPLSDFAHVDCVTYVEQVYALAMSNDFTQFPDTLRRIRYRDGQVDYRWRNHYTVTDWLPANAWFIKDVTDEVGAGVTLTMTKTIDHGKFFADKGLAQYANLPEVTDTTSYIPRDEVEQVLPNLKTGDMIIFVTDAPGIIAAHVGLIRHPGDTVCVQHASSKVKKVITQPLAEYLRDAPKRTVGFKIARPQMTL